ncbi:MAG: hypothetical protein K0U86_12645 [Planctomycetes bacterium]|nr:hypothetical protein [Planctomycetota bacterium]MCH9725736.1 hypothetical protein [Planctomycetota bacterium]MCH9777791.1 hypothetical protein [Planctomycetota bacterium]MCH9792785.1 hypothetical protein [Planctomycetota bacterium]
MSREMLQFQLLKLNVALFSLVLLAVSWRLWIPQTFFPQVPLFSGVLSLPAWVDWLTFFMMLISSICILGVVLASCFGVSEHRPFLQQVCAGVFFSGFLISVVFDQHRLQPWAYQFAIGFLILTFLKPPRAIRLFRFFVISIYLYSALSKCDISFVQTLGPQLADGLFSGIGISTTYWSDQTISFIAGAFPVAEFLIALGLFIPRTRQWTLWAAVLMHVCLIIAVGPLGLNHYSGVLIWNVYFIVQDLCLFHSLFQKNSLLTQKDSVNSEDRDVDSSLSFRVVTGSERGVLLIVWFVMLAPLLEPTGYFDHWPAWGLYASHHDRITLLIDEQAKSSLPPTLQPFVDGPQPLSRWCRVRVDRWSLSELGVPIYPQARFQLGVALAIGSNLKHDQGKIAEQPQIKVLFEGAAHRLTGNRKISEHIGLPQIDQLTDRFLLNAVPRPFRGAE